jgi:hypothetical protein
MIGRDWSDLLGVACLALGMCVLIALMYHALGRAKRRLHREWSQLAADLELSFRPTKYRFAQSSGGGSLPVIDGSYRDHQASISLEWVRNMSAERGTAAPRLLRASYGDQQFMCARVSVEHGANLDGWALLVGKQLFDRALERLGQLEGEPWESGNAEFDKLVGVRTSIPEVALRFFDVLEDTDELVALLSSKSEGRIILDPQRLSWETPQTECHVQILAGALELLSDAADKLRDNR